MSVGTTARQDLLVARRSKLWQASVVGGLVVTLGGILVAQVLGGNQQSSPSFRFLVLIVWLTSGVLLPLGGILLGAASIAGERTDETLRTIGSLPITRDAFVHGKLLARLVTAESGVIVGLLVLFGATSVTGVQFDVARFVTFATYTGLVVASYVCLGVAVSSRTATRSRAVTTALIGFLCTAVWPRAVTLLAAAVGFDGVGVLLLARLSPFGAYGQLVSDPGAILSVKVTTPLLGSGMMTAILLMWTVIPVFAARRWFRGADL